MPYTTFDNISREKRLIQDILPVFGLKNLVSSIVISVKNLGLKFLPYIAVILNERATFLAAFPYF